MDPVLAYLMALLFKAHRQEISNYIHPYLKKPKKLISFLALKALH